MTPKFKTGDTVIVMDSTSPYKGRAGTVDKVMKDNNGFSYMVRFEFKELFPIQRFSEEALEKIE